MCYHHHIWLVSTFWVYKKANRATEQIWHLSAWKPKYCLLGHSDVAPQHITDSLLTEQTRGQEKLKDFVQSHLIRKYLGFHDNLQQSKSPTLKTMYEVQTKDLSQKDKLVKANWNLFQRLLISKDAGRHVDLKKIFSHELSPVLLALADTSRSLWSPNKAVLGQILQSVTTVENQLPATNLKSWVVIDGQALVQAINKPANARNFGQLSDVFVRSAFSHFSETCSRVDVVFDRYEASTIKGELDFNGQGKADQYIAKSKTRVSHCLSTGSSSLITLKANRIWKTYWVWRSCVKQSQLCRTVTL